MSRILRRPMFRGGKVSSYGTGIASGLADGGRAGYKIGGEIEEYTKLQADAREQALKRMISDAQRLGADAVVNVRFTTSVVAQGASEMLAYGTAVKLK